MRHDTATRTVKLPELLVPTTLQVEFTAATFESQQLVIIGLYKNLITVNAQRAIEADFIPGSG